MSGNFTATAIGFGLGASFKATAGLEHSLADFIGARDSLNVGLGIFDFSVSNQVGSSSWDFTTSLSAGLDMATAALAAVSSPMGTISSVGASITMDVTDISNVTCPVG
jgi:hypothetical protein